MLDHFGLKTVMFSSVYNLTEQQDQLLIFAQPILNLPKVYSNLLHTVSFSENGQLGT